MEPYLIKGTLRWSVPSLVEAIRKRDDCVQFEEVHADYRGSTWKAERGNGSPREFTYTIEDAHAEGRVTPGSMWEKQPAAMCSATAARKLAAMVWPEVEQ